MLHPNTSAGNGENAKAPESEHYVRPAAWRQMKKVIEGGHPDIADLMGEIELIANGYPRDAMAAALFCFVAADKETRDLMKLRWYKWTHASELLEAPDEIILREDRAILTGRQKEDLAAIERKLAGVDEHAEAIRILATTCGPDGIRCPHCGQQFKYAGKLRLHLYRKHGDRNLARALYSKGCAELGIK